MSRRVLLVGVGVLLLVGGFLWLRARAYAPAGTDEQQILTQIQRAERAAELLSASGLMRVISAEYKDEHGVTRPVVGYQTRRLLREATGLEVTIPMNHLRIEVAPDGQQATSSGPVELRITNRQGQPRTLSLNPRAEWRKEPARRYLLFPVQAWRVVRVDGMEGVGE